LGVCIWIVAHTVGHRIALCLTLLRSNVVVLTILNPLIASRRTDSRAYHAVVAATRRARFAVTSFVVVVRLAEGVEMHTTSVKIEAYIRDVLLKERQLGIRVPNISCNTEWILIAIRNACFFSLRASRLGEIIEAQAVEAAATIVYEFQFFVALV